jgi:diaminopimelate epimerase
MARAFTKVEGLGNDFVVFDRRSAPAREIAAELEQLRAEAPAICDRHTGVGADGILVIGPPTAADRLAGMIVVNADGSRPEMCGNGLRCVALMLARATGQSRFVLDTDAGPRAVWVPDAGAPGGPGYVEVEMGPAVDTGVTAPDAADQRSFLGVSMGNPHAIMFVGEADDPEVLARVLGPGVATDPAYPEGTNVEFARVDAHGRIRLVVWERGAGLTSACGTGACATAAAAVRTGRVPGDAPVWVDLPGGALRIDVPADASAPVRMYGPARVVFEGVLA